MTEGFEDLNISFLDEIIKIINQLKASIAPYNNEQLIGDTIFKGMFDLFICLYYGIGDHRF